MTAHCAVSFLSRAVQPTCADATIYIRSKSKHAFIVLTTKLLKH